MTLMAAPGAISVGLTDRTALADDHEQLAVFRNMTPEDWITWYQNPLDVRMLREAYDNPSDDAMINAARMMNRQGNEVIDGGEENILINLIDTLFDSGLGYLEDIRERISDIVDHLQEGVNRVTDAVGVIIMGALDVARDRYEDFDLDRIRHWVARRVVLAMEGIITMGSLLNIVGRVPIRHPLLIVGAFLYAAQADYE